MALQRLKPEIMRWDLRKSRLWREDLVAIVEFMRQCDSTATVYADEWRLTDIESDLRELSEQKHIERIRSLTAETTNGNLKLRLGRDVADLTVEGSDLKVRGAANEIVWRVVSREVYWLPRAASSKEHSLIAILPSAAVVMLIATAVLFFEDVFRGPFQSFLVAAIGIAGGLFGAFLAWQVSGSRSLISTRLHAEAPTFWERKHDDIWISIASLTTGAVLGYLLAKLDLLGKFGWFR